MYSKLASCMSRRYWPKRSVSTPHNSFTTKVTNKIFVVHFYEQQLLFGSKNAHAPEESLELARIAPKTPSTLFLLSCFVFGFRTGKTRFVLLGIMTLPKHEKHCFCSYVTTSCGSASCRQKHQCEI